VIQWPFFGELMAISAAVLFSWVALLFTSAGRRLGVSTVNLVRLPAGAACLALMHFLLHGQFWPDGLGGTGQFWLGLSGVVGLALGDSALFLAFTRIGPRRALLLMATSPIFTVLIAWFALDEQLGWRALLGIVVIILGVMLATVGREVGREERAGTLGKLTPAQLRTGYLLALAAAIGQGLGSVFSKLGMAGDVGALGATLVRMCWAALAMVVLVLPFRRFRPDLERLRDRRGLLALTGGILLGPFISVWLSLLALKYAEAGVAQVLMGMVPVFVIVPAWIVYRDRPSWRSLSGALIAVGGGALLFLR